MPVPVLLIVVVVLFVGLLFVADRVVKAIRRVRRRRDANRRLIAAAAQAEARHRSEEQRPRPAGRSPPSCPPSTISTRAAWSSPVRVVVLSDTHAPRRWRACPPRVAAELRGADRILHAGDVCTAAVLAELAQYAPVTAVAGNNDGPDVAD